MMHRRSLLSGAAALAVTTSLPAGVFADALTAEEAELLAQVPERARAELLEGLRHKNPAFRKMTAWICRASEDQLKWLAVVTDRVQALYGESGARGRGLNAQRAIARGYFTEEAFYSAVLTPVTVAEYNEWAAREEIAY